jgi:hypothetical protein
MIDNNKGVSATAIILFGLLSLTLVLVDIISIQTSQAKKTQANVVQATRYCGQNHEKFPPQCPVTKTFDCAGYFILQTDCLGVGNVILDGQAEFQEWCGYNSLDTQAQSCAESLDSARWQGCLESDNLCL